MSEPTTPTDPADTLELFGASYLRLHALARGADIEDAQWRAGYSAVPREDTSERARNTISDPVWFALTDPRRNDLRNAVLAAEKALHLAESALRFALTRLDGAQRG